MNSINDRSLNKVLEDDLKLARKRYIKCILLRYYIVDK